MKLDTWLLDKIGLDDISRTEGKTLHVIGTCGECKETIKDGYCPRLDTHLNTSIIDFGCIHFEPKEGF